MLPMTEDGEWSARVMGGDWARRNGRKKKGVEEGRRGGEGGGWPSSCRRH